MTTERIVIVGGPRCGKSTTARNYRVGGIPTYCGDPRSKVKEPEHGVTYLREGLEFGSPSSAWIVANWLPMLGSWVLEGHIMARVMRKWLEQNKDLSENVYPCDEIIVFPNHHPSAIVTGQQRALHKGVMRVWNDVSWRFEPIVKVVDWDAE